MRVSKKTITITSGSDSSQTTSARYNPAAVMAARIGSCNAMSAARLMTS